MIRQIKGRALQLLKSNPKRYLKLILFVFLASILVGIAYMFATLLTIMFGAMLAFLAVRSFALVIILGIFLVTFVAILYALKAGIVNLLVDWQNYKMVLFDRGTSDRFNMLAHFSLLFHLILLDVVKGIIIGLCSLLLIVPGVMVGLSLSQSCNLYIDAYEHGNHISIIDAMKTSSNIMRGHKMDLFVLNLVFGIEYAVLALISSLLLPVSSFLTGVIMILLTCVIVFILLYFTQSNSIFYNKLLEEQGVPLNNSYQDNYNYQQPYNAQSQYY